MFYFPLILWFFFIFFSMLPRNVCSKNFLLTVINLIEIINAVFFWCLTTSISLTRCVCKEKLHRTFYIMSFEFNVELMLERLRAITAIE